MTYRLGILDQSRIADEDNPQDALQATIRLAEQAEEWGYERFWVSEHHGKEELAGASPEILMSYLLAKTKTIRIGSGGVMLQHYSSYKVAENFHVLANLASGRIDAGIGKGPGGGPKTSEALRQGGPDTIPFTEKLQELDRLLRGSYTSALPSPIPAEPPDRFLLGAGVKSAELAAEHHWNFVFAAFINGDREELQRTAQAYRKQYPDGRFICCLPVFAAHSRQTAVALAEDSKVYRVKTAGKTVTVTTREEAEKLGRETGEAFEIESHTIEVIAGTANDVHHRLEQLQQEHDIDEFLLLTSIGTKEQRMQSFQLLSPSQHHSARKEKADVSS
ncbi:hypothetical protein CHH49_16505 [Terribacillus saccharophilus]|uniref:MsnO8 family LLM class oxidoreductase n=1 Tax=Terribacillus saccharophilus TaxID=361277 RepID=UPI000BA78F74|nr:MsnO8 family LLM class oxidoreductase [Terribacillus saccharophilus]PAF20380.1 hypothetical protein CHH49_16505 [Terribacillus saccharophilus]